MVAAIGSPQAVDAAYATGTSTAGIEAQLVRYQKELSDCVNCASAKTPEGKAAIEAATNKIKLAEARIETINTSNQISQPTETSATETSAAETGSATENGYGDAFASAKYSDGISGTRVDVFA